MDNVSNEAAPSPHVYPGDPTAAGKLRFRAKHGFVLFEGDSRYPNGRLVRENQIFEVDAVHAPTLEHFVRPIGDQILATDNPLVSKTSTGAV